MELSFNEKFLTEKISLDNSTLLDVKDLATLGKSAVIFYNNNKVRIGNFTPKQPKVFKRKVIQIAKLCLLKM